MGEAAAAAARLPTSAGCCCCCRSAQLPTLHAPADDSCTASLFLSFSLFVFSRALYTRMCTHTFIHTRQISLSLSLSFSLSLSWAVFYSSCAARLPYLCEATNENPAGGAPAVGLLPFLHTGVRLAAWGYNPSARCSMGPNFYLRLFFSFIPWLLFPRTFFSLFFSPKSCTLSTILGLCHFTSIRFEHCLRRYIDF